MYSRYGTFILTTLFLLTLSININAQNQFDFNNDGNIKILILGASNSIDGGAGFSPNQIAEELQNILMNDSSINQEIHIDAEDINLQKWVTTGLGGAGTEYNWLFSAHSLTQYYYWPEGRDERWSNLSGNEIHDWDFVIIGADPYFISKLPGFYALGVNKIANKVEEGEAKPLLMMMWPQNQLTETEIDHFEEYTYRISNGAKAELETIPAGLAWNALPDNKKDSASSHPSPNGAYLTASSIYSKITKASASNSDYNFDNEIADLASTVVSAAENQSHYSGIRSFLSPFKSCDIGDSTINYNHTGTSSENGIRAGMNWIFNQSYKTLQNGGTPPINFNYGRANNNFEPNKRYKIDPDQFDYSFGFPMQDHGNHGNNSMLYGIDRRQSGTINDTDVGVARYMIDNNELPYGRAIPVRTLYAQIQEIIPDQSAYRDSWHMHRDLDKAIGAYIYTLLNGTCVVGPEPDDQDSDQWKTWIAHKIGYETAWNLMYLEGVAPECNTLFDNDADGFNSFVDCDDLNGLINPNQTEVTYNGIDDDCNPITLDDDLDQDGFTLDNDCDDQNPLVNPNQTEVTYNGVDDDCNPITLDDDLDQDGFTLVDDCNDQNPLINPDADDIPGNGVDEDCDGMDLITSTSQTELKKVKVYPSPVRSILFIKLSQITNYRVTVYDYLGKIYFQGHNLEQIDMNEFNEGNYYLEIKDIDSRKVFVENIIKVN